MPPANAENVPGAHGVHESAESSPDTVPAAHVVHTPLPVSNTGLKNHMTHHEFPPEYIQ